MSSLSAVMPARKGILGTPLTLRQSDDKLSAVSSSYEKSRSVGEEKNPIPFVQEDGFTDIVLVVEGKRLHTSKSLLNMSSPVLARMLASPEQKDQREFPLQGKSYDTIHELLYILHPAYQRRVTGNRYKQCISCKNLKNTRKVDIDCRRTKSVKSGSPFLKSF